MLLLVCYCRSDAQSGISLSNSSSCDVLIEGYCYPAGDCGSLPPQPGVTPACSACVFVAPTWSFILNSSNSPKGFPGACPSGPPPITAMDFAYRICLVDNTGLPCYCSDYWSTDPTCPFSSVDPSEAVSGSYHSIISANWPGCDCPVGIDITVGTNGNAVIQ